MDNGAPRMTSTLTVQIDIADVNDNPSEPRTVNVLAYLVENNFNGGVIADLHPVDPDLVGEYTCSLTSEPGPYSISEGCNVYTSRMTPGTTDLALQGSDGVHPEVSITAEVNFIELPHDAFQRSIVMRLRNIKVADFLQYKMASMEQALRSVLPSGTEPLIPNIKQLEQDILIYIIAKQQDGTYMNDNAVINTIQNSKSSVELASGLRIQDIHYDPCAQGVCQHNGECSSELDVNPSVMWMADSDSLIVSSPNITQKVNCLCQAEYTGV